MKTLSKILVCLDPDIDHQPALDKAIYLAKAYKAQIELLLVVYNRGLAANLFFNSSEFEAAKSGYLNSQKHWVESYQAKIQQADIGSSYDVVWHKPLYEAIIDKARKSDADLVIKSTHKHPTLNKIFFTPNDWQLLKSCPIPLILAKADSRPDYKKIMVAIDPAHTHDKPEKLDHLIVSAAVDLAKVVTADCHVTHCYEPIAYQLWSDIGLGMGVGLGPTDFTMGEDNYKEYVDHLENNQREAFAEATGKYKFPVKQLHLKEGYPEILLPELVDEYKVDLLVLGNCYHSGLVGSTAEKILDEVNCDILSVQLAVK